MIKGLGIRKYTNLIKRFKDNKSIYKASKQQLMQVDLINEKMAEKILNNKTRKAVIKHLEYMQMNKIDIISINDEDYPYNLKQIYDAPIALYIKGNRKIFKNKSIAIVGCRECSNYGKEVAQKISYNLASCKVNIVSGLAKGIDTYAHLGAIYGEGYTTAVLGNGLDMIYPKENEYLAKKILRENGAIITEYPLGTKISKINFPARNRIISGISQGVIVVEARKKSGTLITVDFALEQGRDVYVVPRKYKL